MSPREYAIFLVGAFGGAVTTVVVVELHATCIVG